MGKYEDVLRELRSEGLDHYADLLEPFSATELRRKAEKSAELERENVDLREELDSVKVLPKKMDALKAMNVDFDALRPAEVREIERAKADKIDEAWAEKFIEDNKLPVGPTMRIPEETGASRVTSAARMAPAGGSVPMGSITPEEIHDWTMPQRLTFMQEHADAWEVLKSGGEVTGVPRP